MSEINLNPLFEQLAEEQRQRQVKAKMTSPRPTSVTCQYCRCAVSSDKCQNCGAPKRHQYEPATRGGIGPR